MEESYAPFTFATRLNNGCVSEAVKSSRYDSNEELQKMILARQLDVEKLWYLVLWIRDYILDIGVESGEDPISDLSGFLKALKHSNLDDFNVTVKLMCDRKCEGKLSSSRAKSLLCQILQDWKDSQNYFSEALICADIVPEYEAVGNTVACYIFDTMMEFFLAHWPIRDKSIKATFNANPRHSII